MKKLHTITASDEYTMKAWAFDHATNPKVISNLAHEILLVNKAFVDVFGYTQEQAVGIHPGILLKNRSPGHALEVVVPNALDAVGEWKGEVFHTAKNGVEKLFVLYITSIFNPAGEKIGYLGADIDLSERIRLESEVIHAENLSTIGESLARLMHEIRNPLGGISMNAQLLKSSAEKRDILPNDIESIDLILLEAARLETLLRNGLSYVRKTELQPEKIDIKDFFKEMITLVAFQAQQYSVKVFIGPITDNCIAFIDPNLMKQVFFNLLKNAIEACATTSEPLVRLGCHIVSAPEWGMASTSGKLLVLTVDNSGERISDQNVENLFKPFFTSKPGGTGLGLAEAAKIVREHRGALRHYHINASPFFTRFVVILPI